MITFHDSLLRLVSIMTKRYVATSGSKSSRLQVFQTQNTDFGNFIFKNKINNLQQNGSNF